MKIGKETANYCMWEHGPFSAIIHLNAPHFKLYFWEFVKPTIRKKQPKFALVWENNENGLNNLIQIVNYYKEIASEKERPGKTSHESAIIVFIRCTPFSVHNTEMVIRAAAFRGLKSLRKSADKHTLLIHNKQLTYAWNWPSVFIAWIR